MATCPSGHQSADDDFCDVCGFAIGPAAVPATIAATAPAQCPHCGIPRAGQFCEACGYDFTVIRVGAEPPATRIELATPPSAARPPMPAAPSAPPAPVPGASAPPPSVPAASVPAASVPAASVPAASVPVPSAAETVDPALAAAARVAPRLAAPPSGPPDGAAWTAVVTADRAYYDSVQADGGPGADGISFPVYCPQRRFRLAGAEVRIGRRSAHSGIDPEIDLTGPPADPGVSRLHAVLLRAGDGSWSVVDPGSANGTLVNGDEIARDQIVPLHDGDRIHLGAWTELRIISEGSRGEDEQQSSS
jgi:FHA domain